MNPEHTRREHVLNDVSLCVKVLYRNESLTVYFSSSQLTRFCNVCVGGLSVLSYLYNCDAYCTKFMLSGNLTCF